MATETRNEFRPDYASHPGETLEETLKALGMSKTELARRMGRSKVEVSRIVTGKASVTPETALQLERALNVPASLWNGLQCHFDELDARNQERRKLTNQLGWLKHMPYRRMAQFGWVSKVDDAVDRLRSLLDFFGVASINEWDRVWEVTAVRFRVPTSRQPEKYVLSAWLRQGEREAAMKSCELYDEGQFLVALEQARRLTRESPDVYLPRLTEVCARSGVAVVLVPELPGMGASGATRWLSPTKALIQLCLRYKTDDHLWFTFFHEAGHILRHGKRDTFIDTQPWKYGAGAGLESEANRFAADFLIPPADYRFFPQGRHISKADVRYFADKIGVAPGIVVGRLQHDGRLPFSHCNDLKVHLKWAN
jgi:addiction module HigA family antidote